ncbi:hypothetical protein BG53_04005 [Paenibacillus darwinianus]|uniref:Uncharacterized protein n=1 Tax=Paenibacillus darwinianus TaxID=1380763 RepID=A0A9W5S1C6_9BACL|nr:hypothetical protein [Paenibacillus darwinianus]EXX87542.1 hypothetical protein BG53_04005 [Paenibacillus darwinianus]EXX87573.1 hypothetical protein CH50_05175 [Paenibacillus darwinianus]EXX87672.1 hypothetical protein BG52_03670 [Paenibacillus darwinianus]
MTGSGRFYCVRCNCLEESGEAEVLFKTGYFKVIHPLGCCVPAVEASSAGAPFAAAGLAEAETAMTLVVHAMAMPEAVADLQAEPDYTRFQVSLK